MLPADQTKPKSLSFRAMLFAAIVLITSITGCSSTSSHAPLAMMGASCAPAERKIAVVTEPKIRPTDVTAGSGGSSVAALVSFLPAFTATCRPDHEFTHLHLALAFTVPAHSVTYDMLPMFGSTASPARKRYRLLITEADLVDAHWQ